MVTKRSFVFVLPAAFLAATLLAPASALADTSGHVASIAAKGNISPVVPVEAGLGLCLCAGLLALGMDRRSRR